MARAHEDGDEPGAPLTKTRLRKSGSSAERLVPGSDLVIEAWRDFSLMKNTEDPPHILIKVTITHCIVGSTVNVVVVPFFFFFFDPDDMLCFFFPSSVSMSGSCTLIQTAMSCGILDVHSDVPELCPLLPWLAWTHA